MKHTEKVIAIGMLVFAIGFNFWLYHLEPTATVDPNDNSFQYALVDRTNQVWDFANKKCSGNLAFSICHLAFLIDHWVPNWAEGYNLPFYYSHAPQIVIVGSYRLLGSLSNFIRPPLAEVQGVALQKALYQDISLFQYYHWIIYLLFSLFPISIFLALRVIRLPWLIAGIGALLASHLSTDGLYGLDPSSFLWRGFGLSSQLFGMIWLPLAIALSSRYFAHSAKLWPAVLTITLTAMGHLGLGMMALLSLIPLALAKPTKQTVVKLLILAGVVIFFLSYWIIPIFITDNYHNISFWDPPWKFDSYGWRVTMVRLLNGELYDFGRSAWITILVIVGVVGAAWPIKKVYRDEYIGSRKNSETGAEIRDTNPYLPFSLLFLFWLALYFGRSTWGGFIDLIPGMKEFHLSRFIVGVHVAGLFLAPIGLWSILNAIPQIPLRRWVRYLGFLGFLGIILPAIYKQTIEYARHNDRLIKQANENYAKVKTDEDLLFATIRSLPPGRVFAGRGGSWGKDFRVAETPYFMDLSAYGIPTVLWLPETWSPNSDVEQYFSEDNARDYDLFGIRYVAAPPTQKPQPFWKLLKEAKAWKLYEVTNVGYFTTGVRAAVVAVTKQSYVNAVRLWIQTDQTHAKGLYPELTFAKDYPRTTGLPNFKMIDEVTYVIPFGTTHNIFAQPPFYLPPGIQTQEQFNNVSMKQYNNATIVSESSESDMVYKASVEVKDPCRECIVILKQSFHPNWRATIDGKVTQTMTVFPFYLATLVPAGTHEVIFSYEPSRLKVGLLVLEMVTLASFTILAIRRFNKK